MTRPAEGSVPLLAFALSVGVFSLSLFAVAGIARADTHSTGPHHRAALLGAHLDAVKGRIIVIDPGHNTGNAAHTAEINRLVNYGEGTKPCDTTGTATNSGYSEARFTLDLSGRLAAILRAAGAKVILTHTATKPSWGPCITERAAIGNRHQADAAISIHADGGPSSGRGFTTILPSRPILAVGLTRGMIARDFGLATAVRDAYLHESGMPTSTYLGSDGIYQSNAYGGTNLSRVPKIFIETGNMRNASDAALLESPAFRAQAALSIAHGLAEFLAKR